MGKYNLLKIRNYLGSDTTRRAADEKGTNNAHECALVLYIVVCGLQRCRVI